MHAAQPVDFLKCLIKRISDWLSLSAASVTDETFTRRSLLQQGSEHKIWHDIILGCVIMHLHLLLYLLMGWPLFFLLQLQWRPFVLVTLKLRIAYDVICFWADWARHSLVFTFILHQLQLLFPFGLVNLLCDENALVRLESVLFSEVSDRQIEVCVVWIVNFVGVIEELSVRLFKLPKVETENRHDLFVLLILTPFDLE